MKDLTQYEILDDTGELMDTFPPNYEGLKGHQLRQFVIARVEELNRSGYAPPKRESLEPSTKPTGDTVVEFTPEQYKEVFVQKKCLQCRGHVYDYKDGSYCSNSRCMLWYQKPVEKPT